MSKLDLYGWLESWMKEQEEENKISKDIASQISPIGTEQLYGWPEGVSFVAYLLCLSSQPRYAMFFLATVFAHWGRFRGITM